ncbi:MAG: hypothetical protein IAF38_03870, partial [Bacteroidia bacterium]|nr:hypothetical protein [Bacteroidia bacterium]
SKKNNKAIKINDKDLNTYVTDYLKENFSLKNAEGKVVEFDFVGTELKNDELSIFLEYKNLKSLSGFSLTNSVLVREFPTQINKVNFKNGEWKKTLVYSKKVIEQKIN